MTKIGSKVLNDENVEVVGQPLYFNCIGGGATYLQSSVDNAVKVFREVYSKYHRKE